jgi:hypothetical protein
VAKQGAGLGRQQAERLLLHGLGGLADEAEDAEGALGVVGFCEHIHAAVGFGQPFARVGDAHGQFDEHQSAAVAERVVGLGVTQVDRHQRAQLHAGGRCALVAEVVVQRATEAGEQHGIGRRAGAVGELLHGVFGQRRTPADSLDALGLPFRKVRLSSCKPVSLPISRARRRSPGRNRTPAGG